MRNCVLLICLSLVVSGCAVKKDWSPTGGSRADGTIQLSYEYGMFEQPVVDNQVGIELAAERCKSWGYDSAEAFGGILRKCTQFGQYGCERWLVTADFQCLGDLDRPRTAQAPVIVPRDEESSVYDDLMKIKMLRDEGVLTESEFLEQKEMILNSK